MQDILFTVAMLFMLVILFSIRFVLPLGISFAGVSLVKKDKKRMGYLLAIAGAVIEVISIAIMICNNIKF